MLEKFMARRSGKRNNTAQLFRDNFTLSTLLATGAVLQSIAYSVLGRVAFLPAVCVLLYRIADAYAMATGLKHDKYMDGIVMETASAQFPGDAEKTAESPADSDVCVFIIGSKVNHPMGLLAPGYKELGKLFGGMARELEGKMIPADDRCSTNSWAEGGEKYGFLGQKSFLGAEASTNNESTTIMYFKSSEDVQAYATGPLHRKTAAWWNKYVAEYPHIGIFHELYHVPKKHWETLYWQMKPMGAGATKHKVRTESAQNSEDKFVWKNPLVVSKGVLKSSLGRMGRLSGTFVRRDMVVQESVQQ